MGGGIYQDVVDGFQRIGADTVSALNVLCLFLSLQ